MLLNSGVFLWLFLPIVLCLYYLTNRRMQNGLLLAASLFFYAWGDLDGVVLLLVSIAVNYLLARLLERQRRGNRLLLTGGILINLLPLFYYKYLTFFISQFAILMGTEAVFQKPALPVGISFFTFEAISYIVKVYKTKKGEGNTPALKNPFDLALYLSLFATVLSGPIMDYSQMHPQLYEREITLEKFAYGLKRFLYGLSKKVILAGAMAEIADTAFSTPATELGAAAAWLGAIGYSLQIYFDFSGYSDMAVGLGAMFGFSLKENFRYPYLSASISEFWRRWHISLSDWFKNYIYFPLGGSRKGILRTCVNTMIVFLATGIWHGANWTFFVWGLMNGALIVLERCIYGKWIEKGLGRAVGHLYTVTAFVLGWVIFRSESFAQANAYIVSMFGGGTGVFNAVSFMDTKLTFCLLAALLLCGPLQVLIPKFKEQMVLVELAGWELPLLVCAAILSLMWIAGGAYSPYIYFQF